MRFLRLPPRFCGRHIPGEEAKPYQTFLGDIYWTAYPPGFYYLME